MFSRPSRVLAKLLLALTALSLLVVAAIKIFSPPQADLWQKWANHDPDSTVTVSHQAWEELLQKYVVMQDNGTAVIRYASFSHEDAEQLNNYVAALEEVTVTRLNRNEQRAYWINLYNAVTAKVVLDHYPVESIKDIDIATNVLANGPWKAKLIGVEGRVLTLDDIEHRILRPIWQDPRTHYAINCGAISCPNLYEHAFTVETLEKALDRLARAYINNPRGIEVRDGNVYASKIFKWFESDFGGSEEAILEHVREFANADLREKLIGVSSIFAYRYDWALNDAPVQYAQTSNAKPEQTAQLDDKSKQSAKPASKKAQKRRGNKFSHTGS